MNDRNTQLLAEFENSIAAIEESAKGLAHRVANAHSERSILGYQAEWHIRGLTYHLRRCLQHHLQFVREVSARASTGASIIVMYAPVFQEMMFEFYALVNLCKISLDNIRIYVRPLFVTSSHQLPKSITSVLEGSSNCPVYQSLAEQPLLEYLTDLRNCLVHYRSFATRDNAIVREEGAGNFLDEGADDTFLKAMALVDFRRVEPNGISVNVCLPDRIFERKSTAGKSLAEFSYAERLNMISMARNFVQLTAGALTATLHLLADLDGPAFRFSARAAKR